MAGQKPNNFSTLNTLDGLVEFYTQTNDLPRKFTMDDLVDYLDNNLTISGSTNYWEKNVDGVYNSTDDIAIGTTPDNYNKMLLQGNSLYNFKDNYDNEYKFRFGRPDIISDDTNDPPVELSYKNVGVGGVVAGSRLYMYEAGGDAPSDRPQIVLESSRYDGVNFSSVYQNISTNAYNVSLTDDDQECLILMLNDRFNIAKSNYLFGDQSGVEFKFEHIWLSKVKESRPVSEMFFTDGQVDIVVSNPVFVDFVDKRITYKYAGLLGINTTINIELPTYADNVTAILGGLVTNDVYKTATGEVRIVV